MFFLDSVDGLSQKELDSGHSYVERYHSLPPSGHPFTSSSSSVDRHSTSSRGSDESSPPIPPSRKDKEKKSGSVLHLFRRKKPTHL